MSDFIFLFSSFQRHPWESLFARPFDYFARVVCPFVCVFACLATSSPDKSYERLMAAGTFKSCFAVRAPRWNVLEIGTLERNCSYYASNYPAVKMSSCCRFVELLDGPPQNYASRVSLRFASSTAVVTVRRFQTRRFLVSIGFAQAIEHLVH